MGKIKFDIAEWEEKLKNGADVNICDNTGKTALAYTCSNKARKVLMEAFISQT